VKPLNTRGSWIQMDAPPILHGLHEQKMTVPTNEDVGTVLEQTAPNSFGITPRSPADVGHPNAASPAFDVLVLRKVPTNELIVYVAVDRDKGFH